MTRPSFHPGRSCPPAPPALDVTEGPDRARARHALRVLRTLADATGRRLDAVADPADATRLRVLVTDGRRVADALDEVIGDLEREAGWIGELRRARAERAAEAERVIREISAALDATPPPHAPRSAPVSAPTENEARDRNENRPVRASNPARPGRS